MFILSMASACLKNLGRGNKRLEKLVVLNRLAYSKLLLLDFIIKSYSWSKMLRHTASIKTAWPYSWRVQNAVLTVGLETESIFRFIGSCLNPEVNLKSYSSHLSLVLNNQAPSYCNDLRVPYHPLDHQTAGLGSGDAEYYAALSLGLWSPWVPRCIESYVFINHSAFTF